MEKNCRKCGVPIPDGARFCMECGNPVPEEQICKKCGTIVPEGAQFCMECGSIVSTSDATAVPERAAEVRSPASAAAFAPKPAPPAATLRSVFSRDWLLVHRKQAVIALAALLIVVILAFVIFPPTPAALSGNWDAKADAPRSGVAHIMLSYPMNLMLLESNRHGYVTSRDELYIMDGVHIQYEISGRRIAFYSDDNQIEEGTIWGNTIWAFNRRFVKRGD